MIMKHPTSTIPVNLDMALRTLTAVREELRHQGKKKTPATQIINERVLELVPNHTGSTATRFAFLVKQQGLATASTLLRNSL